MLCTCCHDINTGRVDTAVAQHICQLGDIPFQLIKSSGKQLAQVMGEHLAFLHACNTAKPLHTAPNAAAVQGIPDPVQKNSAYFDLPPGGVRQEAFFSAFRG